jgi:hypothetical protein
MKPARSKEENAYVKTTLEDTLAALRRSPALQQTLDRFLELQRLEIGPMDFWPRVALMSRYGKAPSAFIAVVLTRFEDWRRGRLKPLRSPAKRYSEVQYVKAAVQETLERIERDALAEARLNEYLGRHLPGVSQRKFGIRLGNSMHRGRPPSALSALILLRFGGLEAKGGHGRSEHPVRRGRRR